MTVKHFLRKLFPKKTPPGENARSVLIIDDDADLRDNLTDILESEGYDIFGAATAAEAIKLAREIKPWVALVDLRLPDKSGTVVLSELKKVKPDTVCILITAHADVDSAVVALEKGAFYYLRKPVRPEELVELVDLAFETIRIQQEKRETEEALRARNQELEQIIERLKKIVGE
jgi:DNA-binding NtrC family response regulator